MAGDDTTLKDKNYRWRQHYVIELKDSVYLGIIGKIYIY